jgi:sodium-coupled neutral amino acid transporter 11
VSLVIWFSPVSENVVSKGGYAAVISSSGFFKPPTFFIGLGVLSFAYVCQHASFVIAGSLQNPTNDRWSKVTKSAVITCGTLLTSCGVIGYLGFQDGTQGNILNSFLSYPNEATTIAANIARGLLCCAVFFVYPIESFVARHVLVVLLFKGRRAHSGDDHAVLARNDVRWAVTIAIYACALTPALLVDDLGSVYSMTGVVAASFLSYVGPGAAYLAVHGSDFLTLVRTSALWNPDRRKARGQPSNEIVHLLSTETFATPSITKVPYCSIETILWYVFLMPLWVQIAQVGEKHLLIFKANEALKSPLPSRLGKAVGSLIGAGEIDITPQRRARKTRREVREYHSTRDVLQLELPNNSVNRSISLPVDAALSMNISASRRDNVANVRTLSLFEIDEDDLEINPQRNLPTLTDFLIAIGYMLFGAVALCAGLLSILKKSSGNEAS